MELLNSTLFWEVINFLVLMYLLKYFLYKPILNILEKRKNKIKSDLNSAQKKREEAEELLAKYREQLAGAREKGQEIIEQAEERARNREREIIAEAKEEAQRIIERAREETDLMKRRAMKDIKEQTAYLSIMVASRLLREQLDRDKHSKLVEEYIQALDRESLGEIQ